jgi:thiosulfate/3-mercaptopyruvate sulfurtransferase
MQDMLDNIRSKKEVVVDARSEGRFRGRDPEPRPGLPSGHIPGSKSLAFTDLLVEGKRYKPLPELKQLFEGAGVDVAAPVAVTCGSGLTACILAAALYQVTGQLAALYDAAWMEWASTEGTPRATEDD